MTLEVVEGDLWDYHDRGAWVVVPVNIGWSPDGVNNMGAGVALQAALRWPGLPLWWGRQCRLYGAGTPVTERSHARLILFPVKPLRPATPEWSWDQYASLDLIERSTKQLLRSIRFSESPQVVLPFVGCGNGGLERSSVKPILESHLSSPTFLIVDRQYQRSE